MLRISESRGAPEHPRACPFSDVHPRRERATDIRFGAASESLEDPPGRGPFAPGGSTS
ncbi:hypothetical protein DEU34_1523 [Microbacterium sp. AG1240]|nr:hypothetical protein DEU34_1523 [Microbacterium sp. AG1240]